MSTPQVPDAPQVPQVQTVRGPVPVTDLGSVLMHEHVFVVSEELRQSLPET